MRRFLLALIALFSLTGCGVTTVPPGEVGVKVNMVGGNRGVDETPIVTGRVFFNPVNERIYQYPIFAKNYVYSAKDGEGHRDIDESITFAARGGIAFRANVGIVVQVMEKSVPRVFAKYRQPLDNLISGIIHNEVRDAFNRHAGALDPLDVLAAGKAQLLEAVRKDLNDGNLGQDGFVFTVISFTDNPTPLDPKVQEAINAVFQQTQAAKNAEQAVATARFNAEKLMAEARGDSAQSVIKASGAAEANRILRMSLSDDLIRYTLAKGWNGQMPLVQGSGGTLINLSDLNKK